MRVCVCVCVCVCARARTCACVCFTLSIVLYCVYINTGTLIWLGHNKLFSLACDCCAALSWLL